MKTVYRIEYQSGRKWISVYKKDFPTKPEAMKKFNERLLFYPSFRCRFVKVNLIEKKEVIMENFTTNTEEDLRRHEY